MTDVPVSALAWAASVVGPVTMTAELVGGWTSTMLALQVESSGAELVLRLMDREPWRTHGAALTSRESQMQQMLAGSPVPVPRSVALDADGAACGHPAHLMSRLPGSVDPDRPDPAVTAELARTLAAIHAVGADREVRAYESWAWEAKHVVPAWAGDPGPWRAAFALLREEPPPFEPCFLHRDFQPRNVLWDRGRVSGVVDWVETSIGPAWLDVAHCATNLAVAHGQEAAVGWSRAYVEVTGREAQPYFDVMDVVGLLPPPGKEGFLRLPQERARLEARLVGVLDSVARS